MRRDRATWPSQRGSAGTFALVMLFIIVGSVVATVYATGAWWFPRLASVHGGEIDRLFVITLVIIGIAFILVQGLLMWLPWRFRDRPGERASYWHDDRRLEATYTLVPAVVLVALTVTAATLWSRIHAPPPADALVVEVRAEQFAWRARYAGPDGVFGKIDPKQFNLRTNPFAMDLSDPASRDDTVTNQLHLVVNRPADVRLRSKDVLHSFFVPSFRVKQDAVPGMIIPTWFVPNVAGPYEIACAELCGVGHFAMRGQVIVQTQAEFDAWLAQQPKGAGGG